MYEIPKLLSLNKASQETKLPTYTIRRWYLEGRIVGIRSGKKIYVNLEKLIDYLNTTKKLEV